MPFSIRIIFSCALLLALTSCAAKNEPHPVQGDTWVVDQASMFSDVGKSRLRSILQRIHKSTGAQLVAATMIKADRSKALELFNTWKLGTRDDNNGVLLLISRDDRTVEIVTGTGIDAELPKAFLQDLLRQNVVPQLRTGKAEEAVVSAAKEIGKKLKGFGDEPPPRNMLLMLAIAGAISGLAGTAYLFRQLLTPLVVPPTGRRNHERDFRPLRPAIYLRLEAEAVDPRNSRTYSIAAIRLAWIGLSLCGAALAGFLAALSPGFEALEPSFLAIWIIVLLCSALTTIALQPHVGEFQELAAVCVPVVVLAAMPAGYVANNFLAPFTSAVIVLPLFAFAVNALAGWYWYNEISGRSVVVERIACSKCKSAPALIEPERFLSKWEAQAARSERVSFRAWHCPKCFPGPQSSDQVYLSCSMLRKNVSCEQCRQLAVEPVREKKNQQSLVCKACGYKRLDPDWKPGKQTSGAGYAASGSSYESGSGGGGSSSSSDYDVLDSSSTWQDPPDAGGSTAGGGASGNW